MRPGRSVVGRSSIELNCRPTGIIAIASLAASLGRFVSSHASPLLPTLGPAPVHAYRDLIIDSRPDRPLDPSTAADVHTEEHYMLLLRG